MPRGRGKKANADDESSPIPHARTPKDFALLAARSAPSRYRGPIDRRRARAIATVCVRRRADVSTRSLGRFDDAPRGYFRRARHARPTPSNARRTRVEYRPHVRRMRSKRLRSSFETRSSDVEVAFACVETALRVRANSRNRAGATPKSDRFGMRRIASIHAAAADASGRSRTPRTPASYPPLARRRINETAEKKCFSFFASAAASMLRGRAWRLRNAFAQARSHRSRSARRNFFHAGC